MSAVAKLAVTLEEVEPTVTRALLVPTDIRLDRLHLTLQAAFGWTNSHLWEFRVGETSWGIPDPDWPDGPLDGRKTTLADAIADTGTKTLHYLYDFGDGWEHEIRIAAIADSGAAGPLPLLEDAAGRCPPDDVGGPWGYADFLDAIDDPDHERHEEFSDWWPDPFDPHEVPIEDLKRAVAGLAKAWAKRPRGKKGG